MWGGVVADRKKPDLAVTQERITEHVRINYTGEPAAPPVRPLPRGFEDGANYPEAATLEGLADIPWPPTDLPSAISVHPVTLRELAKQEEGPPLPIGYLGSLTPTAPSASNESPSKIVTSAYLHPASPPSLPGPTTMHEGTEFDSVTPTTPALMHGGTEFDSVTPTTPAPMHGGTELGPPPPTTPTTGESTLVRKIPRGGG